MPVMEVMHNLSGIKMGNSVIYLKLSEIYYAAINFHHHPHVRSSSFEEWLWTLLLLLRYLIVLIGQGLIVFVLDFVKV